MTVRYFGNAVEGAGRSAGRWSHAEGLNTRADGLGAHAQGTSTVAGGNYAHAEGASCEAGGNFSHAQNAGSVATAAYSHAGGNGGQAEHLAQFAHGFGFFGRSQFSFTGLTATTGSVSTVPLTSDNSQALNAGSLNSPLIREKSANLYDLLIVSRRMGTSASPMVQGWRYTGIVARDAFSNTRLVGTPTQIATWSDGTNNGTISISTQSNPFQTLAIYVNPALATTIFWQALLIMNELTGY